MTRQFPLSDLRLGTAAAQLKPMVNLAAVKDDSVLLRSVILTIFYAIIVADYLAMISLLGQDMMVNV